MVGRFTLRRAPVSDVPAPEQAPALAPESALWTLPVSPSEQTQPAASESPLLSDKLLDAKVRLHRRLIEEINLSALDKVPEEEIRRHVQQLVSQYVMVERLALNTQELNDFVSEIFDEMTGLGPLEPLLKDPSINDILINGHECVYVERAGVPLGAFQGRATSSADHQQDRFRGRPASRRVASALRRSSSGWLARERGGSSDRR
jgi:Flp pilus assembly protein, ATPase CpaF